MVSSPDAWDRTTAFPYWKKPTYDCDYTMRVLAKISQEIPAWREVCSETAEKFVMRFPTYAAWFDVVEEVGLDPKCGKYPYFYYRHMIPPGFAGVYNTPGYYGNGVNTAFDQVLAALVVEDRRTPNPVHPYYPQLAPACEEEPNVGRTFNPDPIYGNGSSNMMYKGYFAHSLMHSYIISGDDKFLQKLQLVYDENIQFSYSVHDIVETMYTQHMTDVDPNGSPLWYGIDCEVGKMFPVCVSVGGLAAHLHDKVFGTSYRDGYDKWLVWAKDNVTGGNTEPEGPFSWCAPYVDRDIPYVMNQPEHLAGITFVFPAMQISPIDPNYAVRIYEGAIRNYGVQEDDGFHLNWNPALTEPFIIDDRITNAGALAFAHEFNDVERYEGLKAWFENRYEPTYKDGEFYFGFGLNETWPRGIPNAWATLAYIGDAGSFRRMYDEINLEKFHQPTVSGVDFPNLYIKQAIYDKDNNALVVGTTTGVGRAGAHTTFRVTNLELGTDHEVVVDGQPHTDWVSTGPGEITVRTTIGDHSFVIR